CVGCGQRRETHRSLGEMVFAARSRIFMIFKLVSVLLKPSYTPLLLATFALTHPVFAADFFAGKTITISTYGAPGDSYDVYMRLLARHYGKHIPGNPRFTAINQTGAGGLVAMNHAATVAPQDGTFLTVASQGLLI